MLRRCKGVGVCNARETRSPVHSRQPLHVFGGLAALLDTVTLFSTLQSCARRRRLDISVGGAVASPPSENVRRPGRQERPDGPRYLNNWSYWRRLPRVAGSAACGAAARAECALPM